MDEMTITLNSPITDEQLDAITDVDFDNTDRIWFHTKHGKDVEFVKRKKGRWIISGEPPMYIKQCSECGARFFYSFNWDMGKFCGECGAEMEGDRDAETEV